MPIFNVTNPVVVGNATAKSNYDRAFDNAVALHDDHAGRQSFRGMQCRTHPDSDVSFAQVALVRADEIVFSDGFRVNNVTNLVANLAASGAGGLDTGAEAVSTWYEAHVIRKSADGTTALMLHRAKDYFLDQSQLSVFGATNLRDAAARTRLAQGFQTSIAGKVEFVDLSVTKIGSPAGRVWVTIEADASGSPSGTPLATSDKMDVSLFSSTTSLMVRFTFLRAPFSVLAATQYHLVLYGDFTISGTNYFQWIGKDSNVYANGVAKKFDGSAWTDSGGAPAIFDYVFSVYVTRNDTTLTFPSGYDQSCRVGWFRNDASSNLQAAVCFDRKIIPYQGLTLYNATAAVPTLVDASSLLPPIPVMFAPSWNVTAAADSSIRGVPDGYGPATVSPRGSGAARMHLATASNILDIGPAFTQFQGIYVYAASGTLVVSPGVIEW